MRNLFFIGLLLSSFLSHSVEDMRIMPIQYTIISDVKDADVKKGTFRLEGNVKMMSSLNPLNNVLIGCTSSGKWVRSDEEGYFKVDLLSTDSIVYFYLEGWSELVIENYKFKEGHHVVMDIFLYQTVVDLPEVKRKPVIYLYSDEDIHASVKVDPLGEFIFTYPEYEDGWEVEVSENSLLKVDGKTVPYLFWEAKSPKLHYAIENDVLDGAIVAKDEVVSFLEHSLDQIGLNTTEQTDFITYWGPILTQKPYALVQFVMDERYESDIANLSIEPKPESLKRVFILYSGLDDKNIGVDVKPQSFEKFERKGFTVVEWGGAIIDLHKLQP